MSYDTLIQGRHARVAWAEVLEEREVKTPLYEWTYVRANLRLGPAGYIRTVLHRDIHTTLQGDWLRRSDLSRRFAPGQTVCFRYELDVAKLEEVFQLPDTQLILARRLPVQPDNPTLIAHLLKEYPK